MPKQRMISVKLVLTHEQQMRLLKSRGEIDLVVQKLRPGPIVLEVLDVVTDIDPYEKLATQNDLTEQMVAECLKSRRREQL